MADRPTYADLLPRVLDLYRGDPVGGHLHIVLDDGNVEDAFVEHCRDKAREAGDGFCADLADDLLRASKRTRLRLYRHDKQWWRADG